MFSIFQEQQESQITGNPQYTSQDVTSQQINMRETGPFKFVKIEKPCGQRKAEIKKKKVWSYPELVRYTLYLHTVLEKRIQNVDQRWGKSQFQQMSKIVGTRNFNQCRIFHVKMLQIHNNLKEIFNQCKNNIKEYNFIRQKFIQLQRGSQIPQQEPLTPLRIIDDISECYTLRQDEEEKQNSDDYIKLMGNLQYDFIKPSSEEEDLSRMNRDWFDELNNFDEYRDYLQRQKFDDL